MSYKKRSVAALAAVVISTTALWPGIALSKDPAVKPADARPAKPIKPAGKKPPPPVPRAPLLDGFLAGPMAGVEEIVYAEHVVFHEHWYANFGYWAPAVKGGVCGEPAYRDGARLCKLNLKTGQVTVLVDAPRGGVRDPAVDYDAKTIVFSYRPEGQANYHLYAIGVDGKGLRPLTEGPWDDLEPAWVPDGGIVFVSSRCKRWVNCWLTQVATLHRCDADGKNIRELSSNNEQDNTPWPLRDGRILYMRWEYIDRSQVQYHHLWSANPDGSGQTVFFGNLHPGVLMIDAKPIPDSEKVVAIFSPGHGQTEHMGNITVVDPRAGPDNAASARAVTKNPQFRDPWAFSEDCFLAAFGAELAVLNGQGEMQTIYRLPEDKVKAGWWCHDPRPIAPRPREPVIAPRTDWTKATGRILLEDIYRGRNMAGVRRGEIRSLLVLETLPKPVNFTGGPEPLSYCGTFTLERILGTVPVEEDGSAWFEAPALRSLIFVAMDEKGLAVKKMHSFATVMPGETLGCVGCHEQRVSAPVQAQRPRLAALERAPSAIAPVPGVPDVIDYPRDIQPILDRHCVRCHDADRRDGGVTLSGDRGPLYSLSYYQLFARDLVADGRNRAQSNYPPRALWSSNSKLLAYLEASHYKVQVAPEEKRLVRMWIDAGAAYPGTYAAMGSGMVGGYYKNQLDTQILPWPSTKAAMAVIERRCASCHQKNSQIPPSAVHDMNGPPWQHMHIHDRVYTRHLLYDLTRPEKSLLLLAPLSRQAGGSGLCRPRTAPPGMPTTAPAGDKGGGIFADAKDPDYQALLGAVREAGKLLDTIKRFDMPGFRPRPEWVREMQRYGVLSATLDPTAPIDCYRVERQYWESLWYQPEKP